jgi:hypothetical protein
MTLTVLFLLLVLLAPLMRRPQKVGGSGVH